MYELQDAIKRMELQGVTKKEMIVLLSYDFAKKCLKETNDIIVTPIMEFRTVYGIDCEIIRIMPDDVEFYIVTKEYWKNMQGFMLL